MGAADFQNGLSSRLFLLEADINWTISEKKCIK